MVGGGRWGKRLCRELAGLRQVGRIHLVSRRNARGMQDWLAAEGLARRVELHAKLDPVLWNERITAALVANLPSEHFATARWLLENGKHVLVEKPFAGTRREAQMLIDLAGSHGLVAAAAFEHFLASYLHHFRSVVHKHGHPHAIELTEITWHDAVQEERWIATGRPDAATPVIGELLPRALTLLTVLMGRLPARTTRVIAPEGHVSAYLELAYGPHPVRISLSRAVTEPCRAITVSTRGGPRFALDFTREPGVVTQDGRVLPPDHLWDSLPRPVPAGISYFLDEVRERHGTLPLLAQETLHVVEVTEEAAARAVDRETVVAPRAEPPREFPFMPLPGTHAVAGEHR